MTVALRRTLTTLLFAPLLVQPIEAQVANGRQPVPPDRVYPIDPMSVPRPSMPAVRVDSPVVIDGILDDPAWSMTRPSGDVWIQTMPDLGMPASERTSIRVLYDDQNLYVGAVMYDSDPYHLSVPGLEQDFDTPNSDLVGVALDTYHDRQNGFLFAVNPGGAVFDGQASNDQRDLVPAWEGIIHVRTSVNDSSWIAEFAIPFATLRFSPVDGEQVWGVNFSRRIRRRNEDAMWAPVPPQYRIYKFSMAGTLDGLSDLPRARNLWVKPYALGDHLDGVRVGASSTEWDGGVDLKWGLTPRMTLDLTANTDFSQVEVDAEQVNLSRFSLFFPEKRDFFLENEGTFGFQDVSIRNYRTGSSPRNFRLFHSRRIGLSPTREPLPIGGGARLTGRIGNDTEIGLLDMQTRSVGSSADGAGYIAENFAVARVKRHLAGGSSIGGIFVNRQDTGGQGTSDYNRAYGLDANVAIRQNVLLSAYWARTDEENPTGEDANIGMVQTAWRSAFWDVSGLYKQVGDGFNPATGFIDRTAVRRFYGTVGIHPIVRRVGILELNPYIDFDAYQNLDGALETRLVEVGTAVSFMNGGSLNLTAAQRYERLFEDTNIGGAAVTVGEYEWLEPAVTLTTPGNRRLSGTLAVRWGDFYDGTRTSISGSVTFRPNQHLSLDAGAQHNDLELGGSSFTADLFTARVRYAYDRRTFFMAFMQYNESSEELIANARFNLIHAPLSDVFLVYTERRQLGSGVTDRVLERGVTLKVTKLFAF
ncbi:MAG: DUF5916 domain-containing protein [Gemmatimonadetes bacterium]|nr:DUF5916 domain-containing protein [Gemmatimonadota bacterium]MDA1103352.1 DUF5916 domain-containing protein [Gemmatimonadota bacterium]